MTNQAALAEVDRAAADKKITQGAQENIRRWLTLPQYEPYAPQVIEHITAGKWKELDDVFWTVIPFGTGGRRGRMYAIGSNAINDRTMGESAQGLADYVLKHRDAKVPLSCAIAYDTRHRSRDFAVLCAEIMVAAGYRVFFLDAFRSTPELSFAVRYKKCACGIMITASHNPPSDNAIKAYWSTGGQLLPPHDKGVIEAVMNVTEIRRTPFEQATAAGQIVVCHEELDAAYIQAVAALGTRAERKLSILYSPMHGVGASSIVPVLEQIGFAPAIFGPHQKPDGDFPNVPDHVSNPENPKTFDSMIAQAQTSGVDLILSSDPDADRLGAAAPLSARGGKEPGNQAWATFTGNQIGALITESLLAKAKAAGTLTPNHYLVKTLVTTEMIRRIGDAYGVKTFGNLLVGFKWIGGTIDEQGPDKFLLGLEESHGYLAGVYSRDKDAAAGAVLLAELAERCKSEGLSLHEKLDALFWQYGCHVEKTVSVTMPGSQGMQKMKALMEQLCASPPTELAGISVAQTRDYIHRTVLTGTGTAVSSRPLEGPKGDMVIFDLKQEGNYVAVRPSGTEPKVKFYMFAYEPAEQIADLEDTKRELAARLNAVYKSLSEIASRI